LLSDALDFSVSSHAGWGYAGASMHDPCPVAYLLEPNLFTMRDLFVSVETLPGENFGRTTADARGVLGRSTNARVAVDADQRRLMDFILDRLEAKFGR
jgi:inosine-uridine nucleoside N-ribohydrolase